MNQTSAEAAAREIRGCVHPPGYGVPTISTEDIATIISKHMQAKRDELCEANLAALNQSNLSELELLQRKAKALDALQKLCDKTPIAIWCGEWSDSEQNIKLGRVGAPIVTLCTMDADGSESNADDIGEGGSVLEAIEQSAMSGHKKK